MKKLGMKSLIKLALVAAIYVVLTVLLGEFSYGPIQIRIAEALVLLCFYNRKYSYALIIGCLVANCFSPYGIIDVFFGTFATALAVLCITKSKNIYIASIFPVIFNGIIIALEIAFMEYPTMGLLDTSIVSLQIMIGEAIAVCVIGIILFKLLEKNKGFMDLIENERTLVGNEETVVIEEENK